MHEALLLIARAIALAHDRWRGTLGRRRPLSGKIAVLEERVRQLEAEGALLRARLLRVPGLQRPHYRLSVTATAHAFGVTRQTILNWRAVVRRKDANLLPPIHGLSELVHELVQRLKAEWPSWGTRRIAGQTKLESVSFPLTRSATHALQPTSPSRPLPSRTVGLERSTNIEQNSRAPYPRRVAQGPSNSSRA